MGFSLLNTQGVIGLRETYFEKKMQDHLFSERSGANLVRTTRFYERFIPKASLFREFR